jgi:beta-lactam-binding protein with PASTA domain
MDRILPYSGVGGRDVSSLKMKKSVQRAKKDFQTVPDFRGMSTAESAEILSMIGERYGIKYYLKGSGRVYAQKPEPGIALKSEENIVLFLR